MKDDTFTQFPDLVLMILTICILIGYVVAGIVYGDSTCIVPSDGTVGFSTEADMEVLTDASQPREVRLLILRQCYRMGNVFLVPGGTRLELVELPPASKGCRVTSDEHDGYGFWVLRSSVECGRLVGSRGPVAGAEVRW